MNSAQAFDGSVAIVQLAVLDPKNQVRMCSNAFMPQLSGGKLLIRDTPVVAVEQFFLFCQLYLKPVGVVLFGESPLMLLSSELNFPNQPESCLRKCYRD